MQTQIRTLVILAISAFLFVQFFSETDAMLARRRTRRSYALVPAPEAEAEAEAETAEQMKDMVELGPWVFVDGEAPSFDYCVSTNECVKSPRGETCQAFKMREARRQVDIVWGDGRITPLNEPWDVLNSLIWIQCFDLYPELESTLEYDTTPLIA